MEVNTINSVGFGATLHALLAKRAVNRSLLKASKSVTRVPLVGNALNSIVAGTTTAALGAALIQAAEFMDKQRKQGKTMDEVLKALQDFIKKMNE